MSLSDQDVAAIRGISAIHEKTQLARDWDGWCATCAEDVVVMPPDRPKIEGLSAVRAWMDEYPPTKDLKLTVEAVYGSGDTGINRGYGPMTLEIEGKPVSFSCKWLSVFKKQTDGSWKLKELAWNFDQPVSG
jgi:ketosteroid isomerase-like protein